MSTPAAATSPTWSAPGKLFLAGEYAVLHGGTALVTAVDRRATGRFDGDAAAPGPLVAAALQSVRAYLDETSGLGGRLPAGAPVVDTATFAADGRKLGLGSSAVAAVLSVAAALDAARPGALREDDAGRALVFALADRAHRAYQGGRGSGADVAAAVHGGVIAFVRPAGGGAPVVRRIGPIGPGLPVELVVFSGGPPSATVDQVRAVERLAERDPALHAACVADVGAAGEELLRAWEHADGPGVVDAATRVGGALEALGRGAAIEIWTDAMRAAARLARDLGGAAKPSGAGGGDVGVAFFADPTSAAAFRERAPHGGLEILNMAASARGLARGG